MNREREKDCCFIEGNNWFRYRTGAIIVENDSLLLVSSKSLDYLYTVGGGVHIGETAEECICREVYEETGIQYEIDHLSVVCENFFNGNGGKLEGLNCHCLELYFIMRSQGNTELNSNSYNWDNEKEELQWIPISKLDNYNIKPEFLKANIKEILKYHGVMHVVNDEINR